MDVRHAIVIPGEAPETDEEEEEEEEETEETLSTPKQKSSNDIKEETRQTHIPARSVSGSDSVPPVPHVDTSPPKYSRLSFSPILPFSFCHIAIDL